MFELLDPDDEHVLDLCAKHLARTDDSLRHSHKGYLGTDRRGRFSEGWRVPFVESSDRLDMNHVLFVWRREMDAPSPHDVSLSGTFAPLYERIPLRRVPESIYWYARLRIPSRECHRYLYNVDRAWERDRVNPQEESDETGNTWSRFFTEGATRPLVLQEHERALLARLLDGGGEVPGLRHMKHLRVFLDHNDLSKRDLILAIGFDHLGCTEAVGEYEKRGVIVYERVSSSLYSKRMLESFGLEGAIRVSPLHCNSEADVDRFLAVTREISEGFAPAARHAAAR